MIIMRAYKTELDPNNVQRTAFLRAAGAARFVYNWALDDRIAHYKAGTPTTYYEQRRRFNALKHELYPWIKETPYTVIESAFRNLDMAYTNFFRWVKAGAKPGFPKFKSRKRGIGSFTVRGCLYIDHTRVKLPVIGWVRVKENGYLPVDGVRLLSFTISERAGRWYVSVQVEQEIADPTVATGKPIGVDLGIKVLATLNNGKVFENPKTLQCYKKRLAHAQRELSRRVKGSKNRVKSQAKVARLHARIANIRTWNLHQISHNLTVKTKPSTIVLENLNVAGMVKNHHLAQAVSDASFSELRRQIEYKALWNGERVIIADRFYPSSKTCSSCGTIRETLHLDERTFVCPTCGSIIDRDFNASINLASLAAKPAVIACGGDLNLADHWPSSLKQEPSNSLSVSLGGNP